ncbi:hypothetical protein [Massilia sp. NP310]|uniref:hypothetical protein n=1 Tax=Massilia sp. NP310 TaxID=2861282 RepID=UPI001C62C5E6|nr:hypothetical protein [Massilia sp. NP310]QYG03888.1 hypothetical protein KY496_11160 [Massilia sp. NP310]
MGKRLIGFDGATAKYLHEDQDGRCAIETVTNVKSVLERAKALHNEGFHRTGMGDSHTASIPITVMDAWARARGKTFGDVMNDAALMTRFLRDPDNSYFVIDKKSI